MRLADLRDKIGATVASGHAIDDIWVYGVTGDSRRVRDGYAFVALEPKALVKTVAGEFAIPADTRGRNIKGAVNEGAQVVVVGTSFELGAGELDPYQMSKIVFMHCANPERALAVLAAEFTSGQPEMVTAVTGTNGKSSTVSMVRDIWHAFGLSSASLGTLGLITGGGRPHNRLTKNLTTPEPDTLCQILAQIARIHQITHLCIEASSQGLNEQRLAGVEIAAAGFTNFTRDHLDLHRYDIVQKAIDDDTVAIQRYFESKLLLFTERLRKGGTAVINIDDPKGVVIVEAIRSKRPDVKVWTYSNRDRSASIYVNVEAGPARADGSQGLEMTFDGQTQSVLLPIAGTFQHENAPCAVGLAMATGLAFEQAVKGLAGVAQIPGRFELVGTTSSGGRIYVDYAHTEDALESVLSSATQSFVGADLSLVFGCGGDRDPGKRPTMGRIAINHCNRVYVTDDNPRGENAEDIRKAVLKGCEEARKLHPDRVAINAGPRGQAIRTAIAELPPRGILIIAGKGHEDYQERKVDSVTVREAFSDQSEVRKVLDSP